MNKINSSIGSYIGSGTLYGTDIKALKMGIKEQRIREKIKFKENKYKAKLERKAANDRKKELWKEKKKYLYNYAHSLDFYDKADLHLSNVKRYHTHNDVLKYQEKLRNREYKRLVRINKKFI